MRRLLAVCLLVLSLAPVAHAAEPKRPSAALKAYGLDWIQGIRPQDLPPTRYAVCIVDSGVAVTPDTPADNPNGPIVRRLSIDGGPGEPQGTAPEQLHGTRMAMAATAPRNGWGTVGMFPAGRIISVRATVNGETSFRVPSYGRGISECLKQNARTPLAAINLSLACDGCEYSAEDLTKVAERVSRAADNTVPVMAAAGNAKGGLELPGSVAGVFAVGAGGRRGRLCPYGAWDARAFAIGPACPTTNADPLSGAFEPASDGGSSVASVETSILFATLRNLRPDARPSDVVSWVTASRRRVGGRFVLNGRRAAAAAGLTNVVARADQAVRRAASR